MRKTRSIPAILALLLLPVGAEAQISQTRFEGIGEVGGGIFRPTGADGDVAKTSPAIQIVAGLGFARHLGAEAEFLYVPILLKPGALDSAAYKKSSQMSAVAGLRITSSRLLDGNQPTVGYLSLRAGFARIATQTNTYLPEGSWIGRSVDNLENPPSFLDINQRITYKQKAFVLSPKVGALIRISERSALDLSFFPIFIFDREEVATQLYVTVSIALSAWQSF